MDTEETIKESDARRAMMNDELPRACLSFRRSALPVSALCPFCILCGQFCQRLITKTGATTVQRDGCFSLLKYMALEAP